MPIKFKNKVVPWVYHGGAIDLSRLSKQKIQVTIRFPYTENNGKWDLRPLTVNLLKELGVSSNSKVYAVDWNDENDNRLTVSNGMVTFKHEHTYKPGTAQDSFTRTYNVTIYGDDLLDYKDFVKESAPAPNGFRIETHLIDVVPYEFIPVGDGDHLLSKGARINRVFWGKYQTYGKSLQGATLELDVVLTGSKEVRLYNPLVNGMNSWENTRTDLIVDWGDGTKTEWYNRKINTGVHNTNSSYIPKHIYKGTKGNRYIIKVTSVEPLLPIGCKVIDINGSLPEDYYCGNPDGLLTYNGDVRNDWRIELSKIKDTVITIGEGFTNNWVRSVSMNKVFRDWSRLKRIGYGFFKENILSIAQTFEECFRGCSSLEYVDPYLLGKVNNVVTDIDYMFAGTKVKETIQLESSSSLISSTGMYDTTPVSKSENFLVDTPNLESISFLFNNSLLNIYNDTLLANSPKVKYASGYMNNSKINEIYVNMKQWSYIEELQSAYASCPLHNVNDGIFGGDFAKNSPNKSVNMTSIFSGIGTDDKYCEVHSKAFLDLANVSDKLHNEQFSWFANAKINKLYNGLFTNVFKANNGRFILRLFFSKLKTKDNFGYEYPCIYIPDVFPGCSGVVSIRLMLSNINIGYLTKTLLKDMIHLTNLHNCFHTTKFHCRFPEKFFFYNKKINTFLGLFFDASFKYPDVPMDDIIWSEVDHVDCHDMLAAQTNILCYRLFGYSSTVKSLSGTRLFRYTPSLPHTEILRGRSHKMSNDVAAKPVIFGINCIRDYSLSFTVGSNSPSTGPVYGRLQIDNEVFDQVDFNNHHANITAGSHVIKITCKTHAVTVNAESHFIDVVYIGGEFPYNSTPMLFGKYNVREVDRFVYAICNQEALHNISTMGTQNHLWKMNGMLSYGIWHKDIFKYHDKVTKTDVFDVFQEWMYGVQPRILEHMRKLNNLDYICANYNRVISDLFLPKELDGVTAIDGSKFTRRNKYSDMAILTNVYVQRHAFDQKNYTINNPNLGLMQVNTPDNSYLEFRLQSVNGALGFKELNGAPKYPIRVETLHKGDIKPSVHVLNSISDTISTTGETFVRIFADKPVWIGDANINNITEIFGCIPECNFTWKFRDLAPNLKRVGELLFIYCTNDSFIETFKGLPNFEYFPGTLFWYNYNANDYESCFEDCPKLFKVDDYIITDKVGDINCRNMFKNSGVANVRRPIMDDINGKVVVDGMFAGCKTDFWFGHQDIDAIMFKNIDTYGRSGIVFSGNNNQRTDDFFCTTDMSRIALCNITYKFAETQVPLHTRFASQSCLNSIIIPPSKISNIDTRYLPFVNRITVPENSQETLTGNVSSDTFMYMERLDTTYGSFLINNVEWGKSAYYRCNDIRYLDSPIERPDNEYNTYVNTSIQDLLPYNCKAILDAETTFISCSGINIPNDYKLPEHTIINLNKMFAKSNIHVPYGIFDNVRKDVIKDSNNPNNSWYVSMNSVFNKAVGLVEETGIFRSYGKLADPDAIEVYNMSSVSELQPDKVYEGCEHMESLDYHFANCTKLSTLPKINHLTNVWSYQHMFEKSNILDIPANYIYTTRTDKDIMLDYMFANNPELFFTEIFIDPRCPGMFSIDYSLNEVFSGVGDDPEIFGHIKYDTEWEHRSRVYPFDTRVTWIQVVETLQPNVSVRLEGLYTKNLVGFDPEQIYAVMWGDTKKATVVRDGNLLEESHITHTYAEPGTYEIRVMLRNDCVYLPTPEATEDKIKTVDLPASFKYGSINDIKTKGLSNMFGTGVKHISKDLFIKLTGIDTMSAYDEMFIKFNNLTDLEPGILDCMPNLTSLRSFLYNTKGNVELTIKKGLFDKLPQLNDLTDFGYNSNIRIVEPDVLNNNPLLRSLGNAFRSSKVTELPRNLLLNNKELQNVGGLVADNSEFILDDSYNDFFKGNSKITAASDTFAGVKINSIPANILKPLVNLGSADNMFATYISPNETPWEKNDEHVKLDANDLLVPDGFFVNNVNLTSAYNMFAGRKSIKSYNTNGFTTNKKLTNVRGMFMQTDISVINNGTFDSLTTNIDARYMFYGCRIPNSESRMIINCSGTFKTLGMLKGTTGYMTEREYFDRVTTDPADIQSMYRQVRLPFIIELENVEPGDYYISPMISNSYTSNEIYGDGYNLEIDWGDGSDLMIIDTNIKTRDEMKTLSMHTIDKNYKTLTVQISYPMAVYVQKVKTSDVMSLPNIVRLTGSMGVIPGGEYTGHRPGTPTGETLSFLNLFQSIRASIKLIIDGENFFKYIVEDPKFNPTGMFKSVDSLSKFGTTVFKAFETKEWPKLESFISKCPNLVFDKAGGYEPDLSRIKCKEWINLFDLCSNVIPSDTWEPFKDQNYSTRYTNVLSDSGLNRSLMLSLTPDPADVTVSYCFSNLNLDTVKIPFINNLNNKSSITLDACFATSNIKNIIAEHALLDEVNTAPSFTLSCKDLFFVGNYSTEHKTKPSLSHKDILDKILGDMKILDGHSTIKNVNMLNMFSGQDVRGKEKSTREFELNFRNTERLILNNMFKDTCIDGIGNRSVKGLKGSIAYFDSMFEKCFAKADVVVPKDVFDMVDIRDEERLDARTTKLNTLNAFTINVTPEEAVTMSTYNVDTTDALITSINTIDISKQNGVNVSDDILIDSVNTKPINSINISNEAIISNIDKEEKKHE